MQKKAASRPYEVEEHWNKEYLEIDTTSNKIRILEENGFSPLGYFCLLEASWFDNYYRPMEECFEDFLSYGFYIAQKLD